MGKRRFIKHLPLMFAGIAMGLGVFINVDGFRVNKAEEIKAYYTPSTHYEVSDTASELASYYSSISDSDTGTTLLSKLQSLNSTKRKRTMGYSGIGTDTSGAVIYTDYDLNSTATDSNGQTYGTKVASFYTKTAATSWNREHMWPNSHGGNNVEADILHTRPTISSENSSRGNSFYVEGKNSSSAGWDPYTAGYDAECRGECARVILYCVVAYPSFTLSDADSHSTSNSNKDNMMGNMNTSLNGILITYQIFMKNIEMMVLNIFKVIETHSLIIQNTLQEFGQILTLPFQVYARKIPIHIATGPQETIVIMVQILL